MTNKKKQPIAKPGLKKVTSSTSKAKPISKQTEKQQNITKEQIEQDLKEALRPPDLDLTQEQVDALTQDIIGFYSTILTLSQNVGKVYDFMITFQQNHEQWKKGMKRIMKLKNPLLLQQQQKAMEKDVLQFLPYLMLLTATLETTMNSVYAIWQEHGQRQIIKVTLEQAEKEHKQPGNDDSATLN